ncbi:hypothetical protein H4R22_001947 [Coemansia sp. RSA 1290]|nr:hypothetical protein H4R22_001947 [Coemansia sp. RSA 1290]KAJ2649732.1 hypothetical protein IWW40_002908 [Coemansia sp. RSA 1250]
MLSGPTKAAGEADADLKSWLPEFDHPRISLDLSALSPPDTAEVSESDEKPEPASNASVNTSSNSASPQIDAPQNEDFLEAVVYANLSEYASMVSKEEDNADVLSQAQAPHTDAAEENNESLQPPPSPTPSSRVGSTDLEDLANKLPEAPVDTNRDEADRLGVDFDFDTDPAIDAISTSPLFAVAGTSLGSASSQSKQDASETSQLGQPVSSGARKGRSRRASIAGMLMRRASKYVDAASPTLPPNVAAAAAAASASAAAASAAATSMTSSVSADQVLSESRKQESTEQAAASAPEASKEANAAPESKSTVASKELEAPSADSDKQQAIALASGSNPADDEYDSKDQNDDAAHDIATVATKTSADQVSADVVKGSDKDATNEHTEMAQTAKSESSASMAKEASPLPPPSQPRSVEKRSSRILSGITRKVNHVRQTTSMVLRRSVGSRLSVAPGKSLDTVNGPAPKQGECSTSQEQKGVVHDEPPQYTSEEHDHAAANAEASNVAVSAVADTPAVDTTATAASADDAAVDPASESQDKVESETKSNSEASVSDADNAGSTHDSASESNDDSSTASSNNRGGSNASNNVDDVEDTGNNANSDDVKAHTNSEATDEDGLDAKVTFTKRFGMVRRGTNEAVRNSVSRMKHIFASKRPVVA